jgi:REP element-mobilizing transposase RayT
VARRFPSRLHHTVPDWVQPGALFHIRLALDRAKQQPTLITSPVAELLMDSVKLYHRRHLWHVTVFLLMPDHIHALLSFGRDQAMSRVIGDWKHFHAHEHGVVWQEGYFDHRCVMTSVASNSPPRSITSGRIRWQQDSARRSKIGPGGSSAPRSMSEILLQKKHRATERTIHLRAAEMLV